LAARGIDEGYEDALGVSRATAPQTLPGIVAPESHRAGAAAIRGRSPGADGVPETAGVHDVVLRTRRLLAEAPSVMIRR
jgi:hypothetical protein